MKFLLFVVLLTQGCAVEKKPVPMVPVTPVPSLNKMYLQEKNCEYIGGALRKCLQRSKSLN